MRVYADVIRRRNDMSVCVSSYDLSVMHAQNTRECECDVNGYICDSVVIFIALFSGV